MCCLRRKTKRYETPNESSEWHEHHYNVPEPENDEDFLIDDVQRHDTEGIVSLQRARRTILEEIAFSHFRKDDIKRVHRSSEVVSHEVQTQRVELAAEKTIGDVDLQQ